MNILRLHYATVRLLAWYLVVIKLPPGHAFDPEDSCRNIRVFRSGFDAGSKHVICVTAVVAGVPSGA